MRSASPRSASRGLGGHLGRLQLKGSSPENSPLVASLSLVQPFELYDRVVGGERRESNGFNLPSVLLPECFHAPRPQLVRTQSACSCHLFLPTCRCLCPFSLLVDAPPPPFISTLHKPSRHSVSLWPVVRSCLKTPGLRPTLIGQQPIPPVDAFWPAQSIPVRYLLASSKLT